VSDIMTELAKWESFYGIVGSAAGTLIGLQFIAMTLIASMPVRRAADAGAAFGTPTTVHFGTVLLLSALLRAPWETVIQAAAVWGVIGFTGVVYAVIVARRIRKQAAYRPEFEDWLCHLVVPLVAYAILAACSLVAPAYTREALFAVAAAALLLLFVGIHNAWDAVTYHIFTVSGNTTPVRRDEDRARDEDKEG
jgi:cbb3-type cytochrome oxidase subunit 3